MGCPWPFRGSLSAMASGRWLPFPSSGVPCMEDGQVGLLRASDGLCRTSLRLLIVVVHGQGEWSGRAELAGGRLYSPGTPSLIVGVVQRVYAVFVARVGVAGGVVRAVGEAHSPGTPLSSLRARLRHFRSTGLGTQAVWPGQWEGLRTRYSRCGRIYAVFVAFAVVMARGWGRRQHIGDRERGLLTQYPPPSLWGCAACLCRFRGVRGHR